MATEKRRGDAPNIYPLGHPRNSGSATAVAETRKPTPHPVKAAKPAAEPVVAEPTPKADDTTTLGGETTSGPATAPTSTPPAVPATPVKQEV